MQKSKGRNFASTAPKEKGLAKDLLEAINSKKTQRKLQDIKSEFIQEVESYINKEIFGQVM